MHPLVVSQCEEFLFWLKQQMAPLIPEEQRKVLLTRIEIVDQVVQDILPAENLRAEEVVDMFKWKLDRDTTIWDLKAEDRCEVPIHLTTLLSEFDYVSSGQKCPGLTKCRLNLILFACLAAEERYNSARLVEPFVAESSARPHADEPTPPTLSTSSESALSRSATWIPVGAETVRMGMEMDFTEVVDYNKRARYLSGKADFVLWNGPVTEMGATLVVVSVGGELTARQGEGKCLALMSIIHNRKKNGGKKCTTVYGMCSDGVEFYFLRLDNDSKFSRSGAALDWNWGMSSDIVSRIRYIMRTTLEATPTSTPMKPEERGRKTE
ncbi:hypothetical protein AJ79_05527 [Helicocarpus griseus UAMH5409]|uniref:Uncharacterized protein n=1 Tax=Helicocarpus griseus UAMH5409 TaxID=1447875 RepID=A0A2B7XNE1_9EURO|nr:hypothetical protein AJ79_05527 [Helicocarpus griseus UAMH5409]